MSKFQEETSPSVIIRPFQAAAVALAVACCGVAIALQRFLDAHPGVVFLSLALVILALIAVWGVAVGGQFERRAATLGLAGFLVGVSVLLALSSGVVTQGDESLFTRFATEILRHGGNPYVHNAVLAALHYGAPVSGVTATWDQSFVGVYPYPAGLLWLTWVASAVPFFCHTDGCSQRPGSGWCDWLVKASLWMVGRIAVRTDHYDGRTDVSSRTRQLRYCCSSLSDLAGCGSSIAWC